VVSGILTDRAYDFQHPDPSGVPIAHGGQNQGQKKQQKPMPSLKMSGT